MEAKPTAGSPDPRCCTLHPLTASCRAPLLHCTAQYLPEPSAPVCAACPRPHPGTPMFCLVGPCNTAWVPNSTGRLGPLLQAETHHAVNSRHTASVIGQHLFSPSSPLCPAWLRPHPGSLPPHRAALPAGVCGHPGGLLHASWPRPHPHSLHPAAAAAGHGCSLSTAACPANTTHPPAEASQRACKHGYQVDAMSDTAKPYTTAKPDRMWLNLIPQASPASARQTEATHTQQLQPMRVLRPSTLLCLPGVGCAPVHELDLHMPNHGILMQPMHAVAWVGHLQYRQREVHPPVFSTGICCGSLREGPFHPTRWPCGTAAAPAGGTQGQHTYSEVLCQSALP